MPPRMLGIYSVAASGSSPLPAILASFGMVGLPTVTALQGPEKSMAAWRVLKRAAWFLLVISPPLAIGLPWAIPTVYGKSYPSAVGPAEVLLVGAIFAALTTVTDDLLRAHGYPGYVSVSQGAGGLVTILGTLMAVAAGGSLIEVSAASAFGFGLSFALALARLWSATRRPARHRISSQGAWQPSQPTT